MITFLNHTGIDKHRWDDCISRSPNRRVYAYSWYLDIVCPGWNALVEDDYTSVFPLTCHRKWGISYLYQPYFTQQLGIFSVHAVTKEKVGCFIEAIPSEFRFVEIHLNSMNEFDASEGVMIRRVNHELNISSGYHELSGKFAQNTRRNIRKSVEMNVKPLSGVGVDDLIALFRDNFGLREGKLRSRHYQILRDLILHCSERGMGQIAGVADANGLLSAAAFFLRDRERVYFLFAASSRHARANGAMFSLIDRFLAENAGKYQVLDFEGGNDPNLGRFYRSFGAEEVYYPSLHINRLPGAVNGMLNFIRKLRR